MNRSMVLNAMRRDGYVTRGELVKQTGLTGGAVAIIVNELLEQGYIEEVGVGDSEGGRKPVLLRVRASATYAIGLELTATRITCVLGDFTAATHSQIVVPIDVGWGQNRIIDLMVEATERVIEDSGVSRSKLCGLGLAIPGPSDYRNGIMINPPNFPDWINVHIKTILERRTGLRVYTSKETSCAVLAEYWFGTAREDKRIFALHLDPIGIGGAFVLDGSIYQSSVKETMNIGHMTVQTDGHRCTCGNRGCLEAQANGAAGIRYAMEYARQHPGCDTYAHDGMTFDSLMLGVESGDIACVEAIKKCAYYISVALRNIIMLLAPEKVYYGGDYVDRCPILMDKATEYIGRLQRSDIHQAVPILPFRFGEKSGAIGALALVFSMIFED